MCIRDRGKDDSKKVAALDPLLADIQARLVSPAPDLDDPLVRDDPFHGAARDRRDAPPASLPVVAVPAARGADRRACAARPGRARPRLGRLGDLLMLALVVLALLLLWVLFETNGGRPA